MVDWLLLPRDQFDPSADQWDHQMTNHLEPLKSIMLSNLF